ncbi:MAG TPA: hypothetical protein VIE38_14400 [Gaiellaceae bacterium]|jgi:hypothetical protein
MPADLDSRPSEKRWEPPGAPRYADLRARVESVWVPELQRITSVDGDALPVVWDIYASSTFAFPEFAMPEVARVAVARIEGAPR